MATRSTLVVWVCCARVDVLCVYVCVCVVWCGVCVCVFMCVCCVCVCVWSRTQRNTSRIVQTYLLLAWTSFAFGRAYRWLLHLTVNRKRVRMGGRWEKRDSLRRNVKGLNCWSRNNRDKIVWWKMTWKFWKEKIRRISSHSKQTN